MRNLHRSLSTARQTGGFTLVELLVVIGIIAILAGVALGPITNGIKKAKESGAMQTCRTLALAEFQFANDNNGSYPTSSAQSAGDIAGALVNGSYVSDPGIFGLSGDSKFVKQTTSGTSASWSASNCSFDFADVSGTGINSVAPDQLPLVWTPDQGATLPTAANTGKEFAPSNPIFLTDGIAVAYHSNNAFFRTPLPQAPAASAVNPWPDTKGDLMFVDKSFNPNGTTYVVDKGAQGL
jgi:prepilin-type N-terminal cleavage/methylation domain-containing protein